MNEPMRLEVKHFVMRFSETVIDMDKARQSMVLLIESFGYSPITDPKIVPDYKVDYDTTLTYFEVRYVEHPGLTRTHFNGQFMSVGDIVTVRENEGVSETGFIVCKCSPKERTSHKHLKDHYKYVHNADLSTGKRLS